MDTHSDTLINTDQQQDLHNSNHHHINHMNHNNNDIKNENKNNNDMNRDIPNEILTYPHLGLAIRSPKNISKRIITQSYLDQSDSSVLSGGSSIHTSYHSDSNHSNNHNSNIIDNSKNNEMQYNTDGMEVTVN